MLVHGENLAINLEELFGDDLVTILEGLDKELTPAIETLLTSVVESMTYDVEVFNARVGQLETSMLGSGSTLNAVEGVIATDLLSFGRMTGEFNTAVKNGITQGIMYAARQGEYENYDIGKDKFSWVTVSGRVCKDCDGVEGAVKTFNEWEKHGLPGSGWSACKARCYCVLDPTDTLPEKVPKSDTREYKGQ